MGTAALEAAMEESEDAIVLDCPTCERERGHEVLRAADSGWTIQCVTCGRVSTLPAPRKERTIEVPVILASGATSQTARLHVPVVAGVAVNDEYDLDGHRVRITAVELRDGTRPARAAGPEVKTLYAVVFDTVTLHYTVNQGEVTKSFQEQVSPEEEVHIGSVREVDGVKLAIKTLKSDQNRTIHRGFLLARSITRVFADVAARKSRVGDKVRIRSRGAGPWGSKGPSNKDRKPRGAGPRRS
jgi:uncharacterized Zn finger protein